MVEVRDPEVYVARLGPFARMAARANRRLVGLPVTISSTGLRTSFSKLSTAMHQAFEEYRIGRLET